MILLKFIILKNKIFYTCILHCHITQVDFPSFKSILLKIFFLKMGEEIRNDVILFCWDKSIKEIIFEKYSSSLIKSGSKKYYLTNFF
jgi:hypothetical protein